MHKYLILYIFVRFKIERVNEEIIYPNTLTYNHIINIHREINHNQSNIKNTILYFLCIEHI